MPRLDGAHLRPHTTASSANFSRNFPGGGEF